MTTDGNEVIAGFDARRLQAMAARNKRPGLGLAVKDHPDGGVLVGRVRPDSPGGRAGVQEGDIVDELSGIPIRTADDLEKVASRAPPIPSNDEPVSSAAAIVKKRPSPNRYA